MKAISVKTTDSIIVSYDYTNGKDKSVLLVGKKRHGKPVEVINMFVADEAEDLWNKLTTLNRKEKKDE